MSGGWDDLPDAPSDEDDCPELLSGSDSESDSDESDDDCPELLSDSDSESDNDDEDCPELQSDSDSDFDDASDSPLPEQAAVPVEKKTSGVHSRKNATFEKKAKTIAYYDSLPAELPGNGVFQRRCSRVAKKMHVHSGHTVAKWISAKSRVKVRAVIGRPISDYAPGRQIVNKGGRGKAQLEGGLSILL